MAKDISGNIMSTDTTDTDTYDFWEELRNAHGKPGMGGRALRLIERLGAKMVPMLFYQPDALSFHQEYYYNTRLNVLFKRKVLSEFNAIWQRVNIA